MSTRIIKPLVLLLLLAPAMARADGACVREAKVDPESPAGLAGEYDLIGKDPVSSAAYAGKLTIVAGSTSYSLTRTIQGKRTHGSAWIEACGRDEIRVLVARYDASPKALDLRCFLGSDADNGFRMTCRTKYDGAKSNQRGLEAMFQNK